MKSQEILLASAVIAIVAGAGASLASRAFQERPARAETETRADSSGRSVAAIGLDEPETRRALDELRMENTVLRERLAALEARLGELASTRTPLGQGESTTLHASRDGEAPLASETVVADDDFVASVGRALDEIQRREGTEREARRQELQAERIEARVTRLQQELGLNNRQASDLRTALIAADDKREALFTSLRENEGDPRDLRESFRTLRDERDTALRGILTPEQFETFRQGEEGDFGRRGFGEFGGPPGGPPDAAGRRDGAQGRREPR